MKDHKKNINRREFIQTASFAAAGLLSLPSFMAASKAGKKIGLQLYTLKDIIVSDPKGVLKKIAGFGYKEIETYGSVDGKIFGMPLVDFATYAKSLGMKITSGHYGLDIIRAANWETTVKEARSIGQEYMACSYMGENERRTLEDFRQRCKELNKAGEVCKKHGLRLNYHNHSYEFQEIEGKLPYDVMLAELDPDKVGMEMDLYWIVNAGLDPVEYFNKYPGRFEQWHVKDMDRSDKNKNSIIGSGTIDFKPIFAKAKVSGMKHFYVEQESFTGAPIDAVEASAKYLKSII